jgi:SAM-dependent methyltransferase
MVERGRAAVPQAQWSVLDAFNQPLPMASLQVSSGMLQWADEPAAVLARWGNSLAPGGRMVHAVPCEPCLAEWRAIVPESPVAWRSEQGWLEVFAKAGLQVRRSQLWTHEAIRVSALEMVRGMHHSGVTGGVHIGAARLREAIRLYDARYAVSGGVKATWAWLAVEATG